jgi:hypothetical protein
MLLVTVVVAVEPLARRDLILQYPVLQSHATYLFKLDVTGNTTINLFADIVLSVVTF